jgi:phosphatidylserine/phosphatidylglycerophosphate/cardiolipin synthase-like enzyme
MQQCEDMRTLYRKVILLFILSATISSGIEIYFTPSNDCEDLIIREVENAKRSVNIAVYSITNKKIVKAIIEKNKEIPIKMITDHEQSLYKGSLFKKLKNGDVNIILNDPMVNKTEHNKFAVIDDDKVITGSYNYTNRATYVNSENCILIEDKEHKFKKRFNELWNSYFIKK